MRSHQLLFYWRIIPLVVNGFAWVLQRVMGIGGVEGLGAAANVFIGMVEAPLFVRPYLSEISRSELFTIMVCGMATIAGTVMVLYASILQSVVPGIMGHLLVASIVSAPAAITISKLMVPEISDMSTETLAAPRGARSAMDAITKGTIGGIQAADQHCRHAGGFCGPGLPDQSFAGVPAEDIRETP